MPTPDYYQYLSIFSPLRNLGNFLTIYLMGLDENLTSMMWCTVLKNNVGLLALKEKWGPVPNPDQIPVTNPERPNSKSLFWIRKVRIQVHRKTVRFRNTVGKRRPLEQKKYEQNFLQICGLGLQNFADISFSSQQSFLTG